MMNFDLHAADLAAINQRVKSERRQHLGEQAVVVLYGLVVFALAFTYAGYYL